MKKYLTIIAIIICGFANAQTGYLVQPAKWKFTRPQWLDSGAWIKNISKYGGQQRVLVYDSVTNKIGYKYISNGTTYTAGRGLTLNSNTFRLDTTQFYTWTNTRTDYNGVPPATAARGLVNFGSGNFTGIGSNFFTGSSAGTVLAINAASGFAGDLMNLQVGGVSKFKVDNIGSFVSSTTGVIANVVIDGNIYPGSGTGSFTMYSDGSGASYIRTYGSTNGNLNLRNTLEYKSASNVALSGTSSANAFTSSFVPTGASSTLYRPMSLAYTIDNTAGASSGTTTGLFVNATETALNGMTHNLMDLQVGGSSKFKVDNIGNVTAKNGKLSGVLFTQTATATVANTTTETAVTSTGSGSLTLPANFFEVGKSIIIHAEGVHSATANPNITVKIKLGGTTYLTTGTVVSGNSTDAYIEIKGTITCRTTGASGTVFAQGFYVETGGGDNHFGMPNTTTQTIDTTVTNAIDITVQWGTASASNAISITNLIIEGKN